MLLLWIEAESSRKPTPTFLKGEHGDTVQHCGKNQATKCFNYCKNCGIFNQ